jgi:outer membrane protein assembly factor BamD (BamD/ComL family)
LEHGNGYFAPGALFEKGFAQFQLQKYDESINTFEQFRKRYPFHPSARGAEEWIEKATKAVSEERNVRK